MFPCMYWLPSQRKFIDCCCKLTKSSSLSSFRLREHQLNHLIWNEWVKKDLTSLVLHKKVLTPESLPIPPEMCSKQSAQTFMSFLSPTIDSVAEISKFLCGNTMRKWESLMRQSHFYAIRNERLSKSQPCTSSTNAVKKTACLVKKWKCQLHLNSFTLL